MLIITLLTITFKNILKEMIKMGKEEKKKEIKKEGKISCPECGKLVDYSAVTCPHCGFQLFEHYL